MSLVGEPGHQRPGGQLSRADPVAAGEGNGERLHRERAPGARRGIGGDPPQHVGGHDERAGTDEDDRTRPPQQPMPESVIGKGAIGIDAIGDDLGDRVRLHHVDPLQGRDERLLRSGEGGESVPSRT